MMLFADVGFADRRQLAGITPFSGIAAAAIRSDYRSENAVI